MEISEALYTTRAMRRLKPEPIPLDVQARILDAAIRAPHIGEQWRFILVDDPELKGRLAELYRRSWKQMFDDFGVNLDDILQSDGPDARSARSGNYLARNFQDVPLLLLGFGRTSDGSGIYPALWSAMLAARAEGIGSTLTAILGSYAEDEVCDLLGVPKDGGWHLHGVIPMGYPKGKWAIAQRTPVDEVAARNGWEGDLGFSVPEPLWTS